MRIGIDIDGVLCDSTKDLSGRVIRWNRENGSKYKERDSKYWETILDWSEEDYRDFIRKYCKDILLNVGVSKEAKRMINNWKNSGFEIFIITSRCTDDCGNDLENVTYDWLKKNNINVNYIITSVYNKGEFCRTNKIDFMIDDKIRNIKDCIENSEVTRPILFTGISKNDNVDYKKYEVDNWEKINEIVTGGF